MDLRNLSTRPPTTFEIGATAFLIGDPSFLSNASLIFASILSMNASGFFVFAQLMDFADESAATSTFCLPSSPEITRPTAWFTSASLPM